MSELHTGQADLETAVSITASGALVTPNHHEGEPIMTATTENRTTVLVGYAEKPCPDCGEEEMSEWLSFAPVGGASYCQECVEKHVPEEERDILDALNTLDLRLWRAKDHGVDELRIVNILRIVLAGTEQLVAQYSPDWVDNINLLRTAKAGDHQPRGM